jgi:radical SAM protein with 4Fe4S-binding SPASM domain
VRSRIRASSASRRVIASALDALRSLAIRPSRASAALVNACSPRHPSAASSAASAGTISSLAAAVARTQAAAGSGTAVGSPGGISNAGPPNSRRADSPRPSAAAIQAVRKAGHTAGIDAFFAGLAGDVRAVTLQFHGGGEPTTALSVLRDGWRHFAAQAAARGLRAWASTITNGVFSRPVLDLLSEPEWTVMFSFDGPRQAAQRPTAAGRDSSDRVLANMRALAAAGKRVAARATLTADGLGSMDDLVVEAAELGLSAIQVEPASIVGRGSAIADGPPDPHAFAEAYLRAFHLGLSVGVDVSTAAFSLTRVGDGAYCGASRGLRALTPDGYVSACTESSRGNDADPFIIGHLDRRTRQLVIIPLREEVLHSRTADSLSPCRTCYMRDTCAGGCMSRARAQTGSIFERDAVNCVIARRINPQLAAAIADGNLVPDSGWLPLTSELSAPASPDDPATGAWPAGRLVALVPPYRARSTSSFPGPPNSATKTWSWFPAERAGPTAPKTTVREAIARCHHYQPTSGPAVTKAAVACWCRSRYHCR